MKNEVSSGKTLDWTNSTGADVASGQLVVIGAILAVAAVAIADTESGSVVLEGEYDLPKVDAADITVGQTLTWDVSAGKFDDDQATPATGDVTGAAAVAMESKGVTTDATIKVKLTGAPGTVA